MKTIWALFLFKNDEREEKKNWHIDNQIRRTIIGYGC